MDRPADNPRREYRPTGSRAPVVWSSELWAQIIQALRTGAPRSCACMYVGVSQARFYEWLSDSEEMRAEVEQAEAVAELTMYGQLRTMANTNAPVLLKIMERRFPDNWRERSEVKVEVEDDGSLDEVKQRLEALAFGLVPAQPEAEESGA